jgi:DNA-directed RNA polymerase II subunit RPB1
MEYIEIKNKRKIEINDDDDILYEKDTKIIKKNNEIEKRKINDIDCHEIDIVVNENPKVFKKIKAIQFGIYDSSEILKNGVVETKYADILECGKLKKDGIMDQRLGVSESDIQCLACGGDVRCCPGHFGYIKLVTPVFHIFFISNVIDILKITCYFCSRILLNKNTIQWKKIEEIKKSEVRFQALKDAILKGKDNNKHKICSFPHKGNNEGCGKIQPIYKQQEKLKITAQFTEIQPEEKTKLKQLTAEDVLKLFKKIDADNYHILGFDTDNVTPESLIIKYLPVPPVAIRPTNKSSNINRREDDLTQKLISIMKDNLSLTHKLEVKSEKELTKELQAFQMEVGEYFDVDPLAKKVMVGTNPQKMSKTKGIIQRLLQKQGRVRGNLLGKRFDECSRTVITPDDEISLNEVAVPEFVAKTLTYPEVVTPYNIVRLTRKVLNGPDDIDGASAVELPDGTKYTLSKMEKKDHILPLKFGWSVKRHLQDKDLFLMNRQPSLHRVSIQAHQVKIFPKNTFGINTSTCSPYNADFDGDEMNGHTQRTELSKAEAQLMLVENNIINPQSSGPLMGLVQNTLTGAHILTFRDTFLTREKVLQILMFTSVWNGELPKPCIFKPVELWSGKQIISYLLPRNVKYQNAGISHLEDYNLVNFEFVKHLKSDEECRPHKVNFITNLNRGGDNFNEFFCIEKEQLKLPFFHQNDSYVLIEEGELLAGRLCKKSVGAVHQSLIHILFSDYGAKRNREFIEDMQKVIGVFLLEKGISMGPKDLEKDKDNYRRLISLKMLQCEKKLFEWKKQGMSLKDYEELVNRALNAARNDLGEGSMKSLSTNSGLKQIIEGGAKGSSTNPSQILRSIGQINISGKRVGFQLFGKIYFYFIYINNII